MASTQTFNAQQALLGLERSTLPVEQQLDEAFEILGTTPEELLASTDDDRNVVKCHEKKIFAPREEWVLRWLLKRLRSTFDQDVKYSLSQKTWLLLNHVIATIPPKSLGRLLKEADFLSTLNTALAEIFVVYRVSSPWCRLSPETSPSESDVAQNPPLKSLKRKRTEPQDALEAKALGGEATQSAKLESRFRPILSIMHHCEKLAGNRLDGTALGQYIRTALGGPPELLAAVIAKLLVAVELVGQLTNEDIYQEWSKWLHSVLNLWSFRSNQSSQRLDSESNVCFVRYLLLPSLAFIQTARMSGLANVYIDAIKTGLEPLLALHVVVPLRSAIQNEISNAKAASTPLHTRTCKIIIRFIRDAIKEHSFQGEAEMRSYLSGFSPTLLETAIRSVPRNNLNTRRQENLWLYEIFSALSQVVGCPVLDSDIDLPMMRPSIPDLEQLLEIMYKYNVNVEDDSLKAIVHRYCGLQESEQPQWSLLSKVIKLDPMLFVTTTNGTTSNHNMTMLLERLSVGSGAKASVNFTVDKLIKSIISPLIEAFGRSRDLPVFVDLWKDQLTSTFDHDFRSQNEKGSLWTDKAIVETFIQVAENNLPPRVISTHLEVASQHIESLDVGQGQLSAEVVIVDAILSTVTTDFGSYRSNFLRLIKAVEQSVLTNAGHESFTWRAYRFLDHAYAALQNYNALSTEIEPSKELSKLARKTTIKALQDQGLESSDTLMTAFEAFNFLATCESLFGLDKKRDIMKVITVLTSSLNLYATQNPQNRSWNGINSNLLTRYQLEWACLGTLVRLPSVLIQAGDSAQSLLKAVLAVVEDENQSSSEHFNTFSAHFKSLVTDDRFTKYPRWSNLVWNVISDAIKSSDRISPFKADILLMTPLEAIHRRRKAEITNLILEKIGFAGNMPSAPRSHCLAALLRISESADSSAKILSDAQHLWELATSCNTGIELEASILEGIVVLILNKKLLSIDSKGSQDYLLHLGETCIEFVKKTKAFDHADGRFRLLKIFVEEMSRVQERIESPVRETIHDVKHQFFSILLSDIGASAGTKKDLGDSTRVQQLCLMLESLNASNHGSVPLSNAEPSLEKIVRRCKKRNDGRARELLLKTELARLRLAQSSDKGQGPGGLESVLQSFRENMLDTGPWSQISSAGLSQSIQAMDLLASTVDSSSLPQMLTMLTTSHDSDHSTQMYLCLTAAIASMPKYTDVEGYSEAMTRALHDITNLLHGITDLPTFILTAECIVIILQNQPTAVNQYNFDNILSTIALAASSNGPQISEPSAKSIMIPRLCRVLSTLLSRYRKQLGGRWHLLIPALQNLLTCLFTAPKPRTFPPPKGDFWTTNLPPWIAHSNSSLTSAQTQPFTRLLLTLSDPTPSSVRRLHHSSDSTGSTLTDETALARRTAGTFLTYFISHYCHLQIQGGTMAPDSKAALMPGIWAILDAISIEGMRVMNAQMPGASERGVWKELYGEWKRVGKWTGD